MNKLHLAALGGSVERTLAVLSRGVTDIDGIAPQGYTPLMAAAGLGHWRIVDILLNKGANVSLVNGGGWTALHLTAQQGHLAVTKLLVKADADLDARTAREGTTPLHLAATGGHSEVMTVLIEAGANPNKRRLHRSTPLHIAAQQGHVNAVKVLLRAKANPLLTFPRPSGVAFVPLDTAAEKGHVEVARELIQELGIEGCGGESGGAFALELAAENQHLEIMELLLSAGAVDTGFAMVRAAQAGCESSVKFLLKRKEEKNLCEGFYGAHGFGVTSWYAAIGSAAFSTSRIVRMLLNAGTATDMDCHFESPQGEVLFHGTPLAYANKMLREKKVCTEEATEEHLCNLEATRRLLLQVEAVRAVSWLWPGDVRSVNNPAVEGTAGTQKTTSAPLATMLPILRRRARRRGVLRGALLSRYSGKRDGMFVGL